MTRRRQVRLSYITFALLLEELMSGPCSAMTLAEHTGMGHRYVRRLLKAMHTKGVAHIAGWEKDSLGRISSRVYALGPGKDAKKVKKTREAINRDHRKKAERSVLAGTPFYGLGGASNDSHRRAA